MKFLNKKSFWVAYSFVGVLLFIYSHGKYGESAVGPAILFSIYTGPGFIVGGAIFNLVVQVFPGAESNDVLGNLLLGFSCIVGGFFWSIVFGFIFKIMSKANHQDIQ